MLRSSPVSVGSRSGRRSALGENHSLPPATGDAELSGDEFMRGASDDMELGTSAATFKGGASPRHSHLASVAEPNVVSRS